MSVIGSNVLAGASGQGGAGYVIERSLRFNDDDSAYLNRTPSSAGNRKTWTFSCWFKPSNANNYGHLIDANDSNNYFSVQLYPDGRIGIYQNFGGQNYVETVRLFRDYSAWYHLVLAVDTTQTTSSDRIKLYVNGFRETDFNRSVFPSQDADLMINSTAEHEIGGRNGTNFFDGYLADAYLIDGQALAPTDFGEYDDNNVWQPKAYSGTYGTNGFRLSFSDNTSTTTIAEDSSGNNNDWTVNNLSVASGAGNDSLVDSPTNGTQTDTGVGGEVVGNYATFNPLDLPASGVYSNGNLEFNHTGGGGVWRTGLSTIAISSGKWYWEMVPTVVADAMIGIVKADWSPTANSSQYWDSAGGYGYLNNGLKYNNASGSSYGASFTTNDVIGVALDLDAGTLVFYKNGASQGTAFSSLSGTFKAAYGAYQTSKGIANFGQRPFAYTAPSGFKALCTANLPEPTIADGSTAMDVALYTGNGTTQTISGLNFSPDLVWIKNRASASYGHRLVDQVRGNTKYLMSHNTGAEATDSNGITAFNSDGFDLGSSGDFNVNNNAFVAWTWDGGTSTVSNTDGSITSSVRANASAGFSIVTWTGTSSNATVGHGLNATPELIIAKARNEAAFWPVYHSSLGRGGYLGLNQTSANNTTYSDYWGDADPTSSVIGLKGNSGNNRNGKNMLAYCFAPVDGYSAMGSYAAISAPNFIYTGFTPALVICKRTDASGEGWLMTTWKTQGYNSFGAYLGAHSSAAEATTSNYMDVVSNGFVHRHDLGWNNAPGGTYIYAAFAENPFKTARAR